jgi:hypothetical protein
VEALGLVELLPAPKAEVALTRADEQVSMLWSWSSAFMYCEHEELIPLGIRGLSVDEAAKATEANMEIMAKDFIATNDSMSGRIL